MGFFSLFGKRENNPSRVAVSAKSATQASHPARQKSLAVPRVAITASQIDAIESEMSLEFVHSARQRTIHKQADSAKRPQAKLPSSSAAGITLHTMGASTAFLLNNETIAKTVALSNSQIAPTIDEAAIMFALGQLNIVEELLQSAIHEDAMGDGALQAWAMLFDLYLATHQPSLFDDLSIAYAQQFETSPPAWRDIIEEPVSAKAQTPATVPLIAFSGTLDHSVRLQLTRIQNLPAHTSNLRLDFNHLNVVTAEGCELLLNLLKSLQQSNIDLILVGAQVLSAKIRSIVHVGRRDASEAPWLLLLELLRLLQMQQEFEDCSIDYCITYEVSPPAYSPPPMRVTIGQTETRELDIEEFLMPALMVDQCEGQLQAIAAYAASHDPAIFNCEHLIRIDFNAASQLLAQLQPFIQQGTMIELREVNHLVQALFRVIGLQDLVPIRLRKN